MRRLTKWQLELLAEYDETVARVEEMERTIALLEAWAKQIGSPEGDMEAGLVKLMARVLDADELVVVRACIDSEIASFNPVVAHVAMILATSGMARSIT
jgi:hypothetical protein